VTRVWLAIAGLVGLAAVAAGALATHAAMNPRTAELLRTGAWYGMAHAAVLVAVIALAQGREPRRGPATVAGWSFCVGIVLFSFSLFARAAGGAGWLGWVTPVGGGLLMLGWAALAVLALRRR
jgi:uncharacterized membrane protein YgdD (TMEM256/DUF423 family)